MALKDISKSLKFWYYQYTLHTAIYMLETWEQVLFNLIILGVLTLLSYSIYIYLPGHILMLGHIAETLYSWTIGLSNNITSSFQKIVQKIPTKEL